MAHSNLPLCFCHGSRYANKEAFATDARLVFDNCAYYNEDNSEVMLRGREREEGGCISHVCDARSLYRLVQQDTL